MTDDVTAAVQAGDEAAFGRLVGKHQRELQVHSYRMLGSFEESQDLTQETFLRAWTGRATYRGDAPVRAWLYKIATNACLDFLAKHPRPRLTAPEGSPPVSVPWLQPYPDELLENLAAPDDTPDAMVVAKETIELAFLTAIQHLRPKERAVLILRDVLGWPAKNAAATLDTTVAAVNSALQRARLTMRTQLPERRADWLADPSAEDLAVLRRFMTALERVDEHALATLLAEDAIVGHQGHAGGNLEAVPVWYSGRQTIVEGWEPILRGPHAQEFRLMETRANRQLALGAYIRPAGSSGPFLPFVVELVRISGGELVELMAYGPELFDAFGLPRELS
ncbi:RNA polymerase subunit sigma-70 [Tenggerimyces flavus]|uniref:RNA polymerase sigma factor n=1 Tax=Tenggerimyces flavus TaxID=1708749 RepID=A0ABV7YNL5_9ACTN|nr:RNA polymerase subunit sigma-70 [Tenggerimyces flavus]MBM7786213.1 RNA polymerase sigma-70 factor (ECF subfamily) [Tenggerimyces flavus]